MEVVTNASCGNDEEDKIKKLQIKQIYAGYKFYDSSRISKPLRSMQCPPRSIKKDSLASLIKSRVKSPFVEWEGERELVE